MKMFDELIALKQLAEFCPLPVLVIDNVGNIQKLNAAFLKESTLSASLNSDELLGKPYKVISDLLGLDYDKTLVIRALKGEIIRKYYIEAEGKVWLANAFLIKDEIGASMGVACFFEDITESEKVQRNMAQLDRLKLVGKMAAGVAHEIRNPMTVVKGYLQFLNNKLDKGMQERFSIILMELQRVETIITGFLSMASNKVMDLSLRDLNDIIQEIFPLVYSDAMKHDIEIMLDLERGLPNTLLNDKEIKQLILNLVRNGIEAMCKHGQLTIKTKHRDSDIEMFIADSGCGIPEELQDRIFEPFFTTKDDGTGLGLSVCTSIVLRHRGKIYIQSEVGVGTMVTITLPIVVRESRE